MLIQIKDSLLCFGWLAFELQQMNVTHRCHFHPANLIAKFCSNKQCTLPLCYECEPIHFQEHANRQSQPKLLRFNQAYLNATNKIEEFLEEQRQYLKETQKNIKGDRQTVQQLIDEYYSQINYSLQQIKVQSKQLEQKLAKLKKGSIKTLIFLYSGDIQFPNYQIQFELLSHKIQTIIHPRTQINQPQNKITQKGPTVQQKSYPFENKKHTDNYQHQIPDQQLQKNKNVREAPPIPTQTENIFHNIEDIKKDKYRQRNSRKSIFDHYDKNSKLKNMSSTVNLSTTTPQTHPDYKFNHNNKIDVIHPKSPLNYRDPSPKFSHQHKNNKTVVTREKPMFLEEDTPISFQQRYSNMPQHAPRPYQQFKQHRNQQKARQQSELPPHTQTRQQIQKENNLKIMKSSDLQIEAQIIRKSANKTISSSPNNLINQRNRASSQVNLTDRQFRKSTYEYDLKKQVLPPEEIRKMLEKRIEERHRILSIKKAENYQPAQYDDKVAPRKFWETKDSIINQIYSQPKYS